MTGIAWNDRIGDIVSALDALNDQNDSTGQKRSTLRDALWATRLAALYASEPDMLTATCDADAVADRLEKRIRTELIAHGHVDPYEIKETLYQAYQVVGGLLMLDPTKTPENKTVKMLDNLVRAWDFGKVNVGHPVWHDDVLPYALPVIDDAVRSALVDIDHQRSADTAGSESSQCSGDSDQ